MHAARKKLRQPARIIGQQCCLSFDATADHAAVGRGHFSKPRHTRGPKHLPTIRALCCHVNTFGAQRLHQGRAGQAWVDQRAKCIMDQPA